jgi:hypothetical protein
LTKPGKGFSLRKKSTSLNSSVAIASTAAEKTNSLLFKARILSTAWQLEKKTLYKVTTYLSKSLDAINGWLKNTSAMQNVNRTDNKKPHYLLDSRVMKISMG